MLTKKFQYKKFLLSLLNFSPRELGGEKRTAEYLIDFLKSHEIKAKLQYFVTTVPKKVSAELEVDGKKIECENCALESGRLEGSYNLISSLLSSSVLRNEANINFNPRCKKALSVPNHYFAPSIAVSHKNLAKVIAGEKIKGKVVTKKIKHRIPNILVGNEKNPQNIIFAHYDSVKMGAIDNASGVSVMMGTILEKKELLQDHLFVFSANEELSYDKPRYCGHGYRVFEKKYQKQLSQAKKIVCLDCVGHGKPVVSKDPYILDLGFPMKNIKKWAKKSVFIYADFDLLMTVYHSDLDDGRYITEDYLKLAKKSLLREIKN